VHNRYRAIVVAWSRAIVASRKCRIVRVRVAKSRSRQQPRYILDKLTTMKSCFRAAFLFGVKQMHNGASRGLTAHDTRTL
jgi:hypothetical protein